MYVDVSRLDEDVDVSVSLGPDGRVSMLIGYGTYLRMSMDELHNLKYEIDSLIMTGALDGEVLAHDEDMSLSELVHGANSGGKQ